MEHIVNKLKENNIKINVINDQLKLDIPEDFDATEILQEVRANKQELINFITRVRSTDKGFGKIEPAEQKEYYALSSVQKRLYFIYQLDKGSVAYNLPEAVVLNGSLDKERLKSVFLRLINRHEALRTSFILINDEPVQKLIEDVSLEIEHYRSTRENVSQVVKRFVRPFDLANGPLIRVGLIEQEEEVAEEEQRHILLVDMHHIITDGVSQGILVNEFMTLYAGHQLPVLELQYKDYAEWQQSPGQQKEKERQREFWMEMFKEEVVNLDLPIDFDRPFISDHAGRSSGFTLSHAQSRRLLQIAEQNGATMFMVLLSAYNILLSKLGNQEDVIVGTPVAGRQHADLERVIGMFVNTLPVRSFPKGDLPYDDFLLHIKSQCLLCFENQAYPYEELIDNLKIERDTSRNPLFDVMFTYQNIGSTNLKMTDVKVDAFGVNQQVSKFDLSLSAKDSGGQLYLNFEYATRLFKPETIKRFITYFENIVKAITDDAKVKLKDIDILPEVEKNQLIDQFNDTEKTYPKHENVISCFVKQAEITPKDPAIYFKDSVLSYEEVNVISDNIANYLHSVRDIQSGDLVGVMLNRDKYLVPCLFGILKAGAAYVPIDPAYPNDRKAIIIADSGVKAVISEEGLYEKSLSSKTDIININEALTDIPVIGVEPLDITIKPNDLAYVIYTSGSTGTPKGVMIEHAALFNTVQYLQDKYPLGRKDNYLFKTAHAFDVSCAEIFGWFYNGGSLTVLDHGLEGNAAAIIDLIEVNKITHVNFVPSMFSVFLEEVKNGKLEKLNSVKYFFLAGEALSPELVKAFNSLKTGIALENIYGPTEATIYSCGFSTSEVEITNSIPIGKPLHNVQLHVVDRHYNLLPIGVAGELCIAGAGLARGYLNNEELTREKFVNNPFKPGTLMYKTGDLARWTSNGNIEFLGRIDHQVKIRGFRIELGEIEHQLGKHHLINQVLVMARAREGDKYLVAYYVSEEEIEPSLLRNFLLEQLPEYMVPAHFVHLSVMPLNSNGKVDRKALPEPLSNRTAYTAPETKTEEILVSIWADVLKLEVDMISATTSFFELGGHSLRATVVVNRIKRELGVEVPIREVFRYQDIRSLAKYIERQDQNSFISIPTAEQKDYYALSAAQKRLYILYEFDRRSLAYNMPQVVKLSGKLDKERLQNTFQELISRHESLRTSFVIVENEPVQKINVDIDFKMEYFEANEADVPEIITAFIRPFDLSSDTLFRAGVIEINSAVPENGQQILMIDLHHIISDGVSQSVLVNDFMALYNGAALPELKLHYKDFAEWQNSPQQQVQKYKDRVFWLNTFSDEVSPLDLPADYVRPTVKNDKGAFVSFELEEEQTQKLRALAKAEGTTMFMIMLAIYKVLLSRLTNQEDVVVGTPVAGRQHGDLENIIGIFVNTLPLRSYLQKNRSFKSFLSDMESHVLQAIDSQAYPYEELVETLNVRRDTGRNPLFDVMFSYHSIEQSQDEIPGLTFESLGVGNQTSQFDLTLIGAETENNIVLGFEYATTLFKKETIERFVKCFTAIISAVTENVDVNISTIDILPESDRVLLRKFNDTAVTYPVNKTIIDYFNEQAHINGFRKAVICDGEELTYAQLNEKANKLANYLIHNHKVGKEDLIVVYISRSLQMIVTLLGILKAGAAYLPLDPEYPAERIRTILQEAEPKLIITDLSDLLTKLSPDVNVLDIRKTAEGIAEMPGQPPEVKIEGSDAAYVIYTSGSTGLPKGIVLEHESLIDYCLTFQKYFSIDYTDNVVQQASLAFDTSVEEIFPALISGAKITIMPSGGRDITYMVGAIKAYQATLLSSTPMVLNELNDYADELISLKAIISGGDVLLPRQIKNLINKYPVYNTYGPSESSVCITYNAVTDLTKTSLIGRPIANREVYITTEQGALCPILVPGELCVAGKGLAREYLGRPDLTTDRFVESTVVGKRVYRTGDLARWLPDGNIEFLGRIDEQVKIRGYRIELGEIETQLTDFNGLNEVALIARGDEGNRHLVCYYVTEPEKEVTDLELRSYLSERLPSYMVPAHFVKLDHLPVTLNGKLNKKALPDPKLQDPEIVIAPSDDVERKLVKLWSGILELKPNQFGVTHNFFELGGQSLKATRLIYQIRSEFNIQISLVDIFTAPTIVEIAKKIKNGNVQPINEGQSITLLKKNPETNSNLFFVHDGSGDVHGYVQLAKLIDDHNCWGLRCPALEHYWPLNTSVEELASQYIELIKTVQAEGPYQLAGWSTGGTLAYEITRQLEDKGESVEILIMIDTILPLNSSNKVAEFNIDTEEEVLSDVISSNEKIHEASSMEALWMQAYQLLKESDAGMQGIRKLVPQEIRQLIPNFESIDVDQLIAYVNTIRTLDNVVLRYAAKGCIKAQLINITARETEHNSNLISEYFEKDIISSEIWGDHFTILQEPLVNTLVEEVKYGLKNAKSAFLEGL